MHLFLLKNARFGALSKSSAIMCFHWDDFNVFLNTHEYIINKLACLVRDALCLEYIGVVVAVIAVIGVQLIAPYHAMTISNKSTHSSLKLFFESLYEELCNQEVDETFFSLTSSAFKSVSDKLFTEVQKNYGLDVVKAVKEIVELHVNDYITLVQIMLSHLGEVLRSQREKYYGFEDIEDIEEEYPMFDQCDIIDQTPVHNLHIKRQYGDTDHRLKKKASLDTASRDSALSQTHNPRGHVSRNYQKMGNVVKIIDDIKAEWKIKQRIYRRLDIAKKKVICSTLKTGN